MQIFLGPGWDTYDFLSDALLMAGQGTGYADLIRPPLIPFITSLFFRAGYVSEVVIFAVDGALFVFGVIGLYLLLNLRFNPILSFLGSILYTTFPIVLNFAGFGLTDVPSVSFCIWVIYFIILAVNSNSKYFYLTFPFLMLAFLTRFTSALMILPIAFYLLINIDSSLKNKKEILIGILASFLLIIPVFIFFQVQTGNFLYPFLSSFGTSEAPAHALDSSYNANLGYYIEGIPLFIGENIYGLFKIILIIVSGIAIYNFIIYIMEKIKGRSAYEVLKSQKIKIIGFAVLLVLLAVFIETFGNLTYLQSLLIFFILLVLSYVLLKDFKIKNLDIDFLIFSFFMTYFIFHSVFMTKVDRYFVIMAPAVAYFFIWGLNEILNMVRVNNINKNIMPSIISIALIFMVLSSISPFLNTFEQENIGMKTLNEKSVIAAEWLAHYDPEYKDKVIYSDIWPYSAWYLQMNVKKMPIFKDGGAYFFGVNDYGISPQDNLAFNQELKKGNAEYYICVRTELNLTSYVLIKKVDDLWIYKKSDGK